MPVSRSLSLTAPYDAADVLGGKIAPPLEVRKLNDWIVETLESGPWIWKFTEEQIRKARREGAGVFPVAPPSPHAQTISIEGPAGPLPLRLIFPSSGERAEIRSAYLHIHGGGWTFGAADMQDDMLQALADACHCLCVSVDYRLAPEHPYPAAQEDCEAAALWLIGEGAKHYGLSHFMIGGESAGAHLSLCTLLRLRDKHSLSPFCAANLVCGCYDLTLTPSVRNWGSRKLVLNTDDIEQFRRRYLSGPAADLDWSQSDISPLYADLDADLGGLPPLLITAGSQDLLRDDSLFLHQCALAAGLDSHLAVYPGGCHVFPLFPTAMGQQALRFCEDFLCLALAQTHTQS